MTEESDMRKAFMTVAVVTAVVWCAAGARALQFSADMVSTTREGTVRGKAYVTDNAARIEVPGVGASITRIDRKKVIVLMAAGRTYLEQSLDLKTVASMSEKIEGEVERTHLGNEIVDGRATRKYKAVTDSGDGRAEMFQWIDDATGIPIKTADVNGEWSVEYKNLKTGPQAASLFEIPAGYKKLVIPTMDEIKAMMAGNQ